MKFRKKPVVIEAVKFDGIKEIEGVKIGATAISGNVAEMGNKTVGFIETLEGTMTADVGDWIITGVKGEKYPCKPDIFEATYELVKD